MRPGRLDRRRVHRTWRRLHRDEEGMALVLAILIMLVLTIVQFRLMSERSDAP